MDVEIKSNGICYEIHKLSFVEVGSIFILRIKYSLTVYGCAQHLDSVDYRVRNLFRFKTCIFVWLDLFLSDFKPKPVTIHHG